MTCCKNMTELGDTNGAASAEAEPMLLSQTNVLAAFPFARQHATKGRLNGLRVCADISAAAGIHRLFDHRDAGPQCFAESRCQNVP
jgi:hypothetical protein